ncbi:hypothetical protein, conserved [Eimeria praecox]|uniref:Uncharacterized protein n=1 Tax=Eimeria praecox TaxID=51316 RepID=U6G3G4_9EIME|nr:hypothetical protein, conserved [Eimeria praecox]
MGFAARSLWLVALFLGLLQEGGHEGATWAALGDSSPADSISARGTVSQVSIGTAQEKRRKAGRRSGSYSVSSELDSTTDSSADSSAEVTTPDGSQKKKKKSSSPRKSRGNKPGSEGEGSTARSAEQSKAPSNSVEEASGSSSGGKKKRRKGLGSIFSKKKGSKKMAVVATGEESSDAEAALDAAVGRPGQAENTMQRADAAGGRKRSLRALLKKRGSGKSGTAREGPHPRRGSGRLRVFKQSEGASASRAEGKGKAKKAKQRKAALLLSEPKLTVNSSLDPEDGFPRILPRPPQTGGTTPRNPFAGCMPVQATPGLEAFARGLPSQGVGCRLRMKTEQHQHPLPQEQQKQAHYQELQQDQQQVQQDLHERQVEQQQGEQDQQQEQQQQPQGQQQQEGYD